MIEILPITPVRLPVSKDLLWNQSNPFLKTNNFHNFDEIAPKPSVIRLYNLSGADLGLGLFSPELGQISYLSNQTVPLFQILTDKFNQALKKRKPLDGQTNAYRLIHHRHDGIPGVIIDIYSEVAMIQTYDSGADLLIPILTEILESNLNIHAILLKNNIFKRQQRKLSLSDQILKGNLPSNLLALKEYDFEYSYDCKNNLELFPLEQRQIRFKLNQLIQEQQLKNILLIGESTQSLIGEQQKKTVQTNEFLFKNNSLTDITHKLRSLKEQAPSFQALTLCPPPIKDSVKAKTALFHLCYQAISNLQSCAPIFIFTPKNSLWHKILIKAAHKLKFSYNSINVQGCDVDFPNSQKRSVFIQ